MASIEMKNFFMTFNNSNSEIIAKVKVKNATVKPLYVEHVDNWFLKIYLLK
jgi:hypothetical protein